jgi:DNA replication protein DnaC
MTDSTIAQKLRRLRLGHMARNIEAQNERSLQQKHPHLEFLTELVDAELNERDNNRMNKRIKAARFPALKSLEEFDFDFQPKLDAKLIKSLASCDFIAKSRTSSSWASPAPAKPTSPSRSG